MNFNKNKVSFLSKAELKLINKDASMGDIIKTIDAFDLDKDGKLNKHEFDESKKPHSK